MTVACSCGEEHESREAAKADGWFLTAETLVFCPWCHRKHKRMAVQVTEWCKALISKRA